MNIGKAIIGSENTLSEGASPRPHYYGDTIRKFFFASAFIMLFLMPFFTDYIPTTVRQGLLVILGISIFSGLTNPRLFWVAVIDGVISVLGVFIFGYYSVDSYLRYTAQDPFFWANELLAMMFLASLYFSIKTIRGFLVRNANSFKNGRQVSD